MERELQKESKCSFYALEQLRQTAEAILRGSQRLLKCRAGVEKYRTAQPQRAYAYYLELQKMRDTLLAAFGDAQRYLLELEESALALKAGQLHAGLTIPFCCDSRYQTGMKPMCFCRSLRRFFERLKTNII